MIDKGNIKYPPIEHAWRTYRRDKRDQVLEPAAKFVPGMNPVRAMLFSHEPGLSRAEAWKTLFNPDAVESTARRIRQDSADRFMFAALGIQAMAMLGYSENKRIYRPDTALIESLMDVKVRPDTPMSIFRGLPSQVVAIELPRKTQIGVFHAREFLVALYDVAHDDREAGERSMAILGNFGDPHGFMPITILDLRDAFKLGPTASFSNSALVEEIGGPRLGNEESGRNPAFEYSGPTEKIVHLVLNILLYLLGSDDITTIILAQRKNVEKRPRAEAMRIRELQDPHLFGVGAKWGKAVQNWIAEESTQRIALGRTGRFISPHIRAAHPHLYWTGPGKTIPVIKFLLPTSVNGGVPSPNIDNLLPTIHAMH